MDRTTEYRFTLYVAGKTDAIDKMIADLRREMDKVAGSHFRMDVVNVLEMPEQAASANVFVTPTLVRDLPEPVCRIIGNLKDTGKVLLAMNMSSESQPEQSVIV